MATATEEPQLLMTTDDLLAMPDDDVDRELIRGELRERPMTTRNVPHSFLTSRISHVFLDWVEDQPEPHGLVVGGEARVRIRRAPDTTVGIDVAYIAPELADQTPEGAKFVDGPPSLAVEILSPSDTYGELVEMIREYLDAGVPLVWVVDPAFRTITTYRPDASPRLFHVGEEIEAEPHLPGFRVPMARIFSR